MKQVSSAITVPVLSLRVFGSRSTLGEEISPERLSRDNAGVQQPSSLEGSLRWKFLQKTERRYAYDAYDDKPKRGNNRVES